MAAPRELYWATSRQGDALALAAGAPFQCRLELLCFRDGLLDSSTADTTQTRYFPEGRSICSRMRNRTGAAVHATYVYFRIEVGANGGRTRAGAGATLRYRKGLDAADR